MRPQLPRHALDVFRAIGDSTEASTAPEWQHLTHTRRSWLRRRWRGGCVCGKHGGWGSRTQALAWCKEHVEGSA